MNGEAMKAALKGGERVYGTMFVQTRVGNGDHRLREMGLNYVIVDNEHSPYSRGETAAWMRKLAGNGIVPIVRVPIPASHYVTMALDAGAHGVLAPYVERVEQVQEVVGAAKLLPLKGEAVMRAMTEGRFPSEETRQHLEQRNRNNLLVIGIESVAAMERLEDLLSVQGVDAAFVGPNDLSIQLGVPADYQHPRYLEAVEHIHATCKAKGMPLVIHFFNYEMAQPWIERGIHFVLFGTDRRGIGDAMKKDFDFLRGLEG
jgi:staphyloferrin B biosynthesis citrate synthase